MAKSGGRTPNSPGPYYGDGTHRGDQGYAYSIYFGERHYEWLANTAGKRGVSRARVIKELIDQAMQWDEQQAIPTTKRYRHKAVGICTRTGNPIVTEQSEQ